VGVGAAQFLEIGCNALVDRPKELWELVGGKGALLRVHRSDRAAIDGAQFRPKEVQLLAEQGPGAAALSYGREVVWAEGNDGLVSGPERLQQPQQCDVAGRLLLQATT